MQARQHHDDWCELDATEQARLVATGQTSPRELVEAAIQRIESLDAAVGAVPVRIFEDALRRATAKPTGGRFFGVPFLMKDVGARQAGQPYYAGNRALSEADHRAASDTPLGARFREIGLVTLGNSSAPEFGLQSNTWPLVYGPTRNPWDLSRAAGGSSGGACAAVAAGFVPVAHATDGAGSIRIPASWCGLIGLKPSRDLVIWRHAGERRPDVEFIVARSLRDTAALLDALRPRRQRESDPSRFLESIAGACQRLRIAFCRRSPAGSAVEPSCSDAVETTALALEARGHVVSEAAPTAFEQYADRALHGVLLGPLGYRECLEDLGERLGRPADAQDVEPFLWEIAMGHDTVEVTDAAELERSIEWIGAWERALLSWFDDWDILVTPTVHEPAPALDSLDPREHTPLDLLEKMVPHMAFTEPWNATGQPAISLPLGWTEDGMPLGVQLVARVCDDHVLLAVAAQLLEDLGQPARRPRVHA